jgi:Restriction alleviation protein Lar
MIDDDEFEKSLKPCPFCNRGKTQVEIKRHWCPINKPREVISVIVRHWCEKLPGQLFSHIEMRGRDHDSVREAWNKRV